MSNSQKWDDCSSWQVFSCESHFYSMFPQAFLYHHCQRATKSFTVVEGNIFTKKMYWFYFLTHHTEHGVPKPSSASLLPFLWRLGRQQSSHAVNNVAGSLAHIADLAAETGAHGHACPGPAVRHRAHQLPPAESARGEKEKFLPFMSNLEAFIFCV